MYDVSLVKPFVKCIWFFLFQKRTLRQVQGAKTESQASEANPLIQPRLVDSTMNCLKCHSVIHVLLILYHITFVFRYAYAMDNRDWTTLCACVKCNFRNHRSIARMKSLLRTLWTLSLIIASQFCEGETLGI